MRILAGDVGGTHTRLALFDGDLVATAVHPTEKDVPLERLVERFLTDHSIHVDRAVLGVAAAVRDGRSVESTNLPWPVDAESIARSARVEHAVVVNDVEACAYGVDLVSPGDVVTLNAGALDSSGNRVVVSVGTGLGVAGVVENVVFATEAGYADFAARSELEAALRAWLATRYRHVSYERVCSGSGLVDIHRFLTGRVAQPEEIAGPALETMLAVLGAFAGNMALSLLATGGVYLAGGIPKRVLRTLEAGGFLEAFFDKGRLRSLLERIPVHVIVGERTALLGAARLAGASHALDHPAAKG